MNRGFREVRPTSDQSSWSPNEQPNMVIVIPPGSEMIRNSFAIHGSLKPRKAAAVLDYTAGNDFKMDPQIGAHVLCDNFVTSFSGKGMSETINNYGRYVKMVEQVNSNDEERHTMSDKNIELKCASEKDSKIYLVGRAGTMGFTIKPLMALNRTSRNISSKDTPEIKLQWTWNDVYKAFYGADVTTGNTPSYTIENLRCSYMIQPISKASEGPLLIKTVRSSIYTADSKLTSLSMILPIDTLSVALSASVQANRASPNNDNNIDTIGVNNVKWLFNDANNKLVAYELKKYPELMFQYSKVLAMSPDRSIDSLSQSKSGNYGIGMDFGGMIASGNKVTLDLDSDASNVNVYDIFIYYHRLYSL